jgi:hypothetical protein
MSKLAWVLTVGVMLAATTLGSMSTVAYANGGPIESTVTRDGRRPSTERQVGEPYHHRAAQQQATTDATIRAALAQERHYSTWSHGDPAIQQALAQERYHSAWGYGDTSTPAPAKPGGRPDWLVPGLGVLGAVHSAGRAGRQAGTPQGAGRPGSLTRRNLHARWGCRAHPAAPSPCRRRVGGIPCRRPRHCVCTR